MDAAGSRAERRVPAVAVVDSRNVWGAAKCHFGAGRQVTAAGVRAALASYGFDVAHVYVGIGATTSSQNPSARLRDVVAQNLRYAEAIDREPEASALRGRMVERRGDLEEKLVDVLCAMQIARSAHEIVAGATSAKAIVVLSEDMDLIPAYRFAQDLGVHVVAAAHRTVDTRPDAPWLLLGEAALREMCGTPYGRDAGADLRRRIAGWVLCPRAPQLAFKAIAWEPSPGSLRLRHNSGALGLWVNPPKSIDRSKGLSHQLWLHGLHPCDSEADYPILALGDAPPTTWPPKGLVRAEVTDWRTPTRLTARLASGGVRSLAGWVGATQVGDEILVQEQRSATQSSWRFIGRTGPDQTVAGWRANSKPMLATVEAPGLSAGARVQATLPSGQSLSLQPPAQETPDVGTTYACVPVAARDGNVLAMAVSSALPFG